MRTRVTCPSCCNTHKLPLPVGLIHTGSVEHPPFEPDGLLYLQCSACDQWNRYEVPPPNPVVQVAA